MRQQHEVDDDEGVLPGDDPRPVEEFERPRQIADTDWSSLRPSCVVERKAHHFPPHGDGVCPYCGTRRQRVFRPGNADGTPWRYIMGEWSGKSFTAERLERWNGRR